MKRVWSILRAKELKPLYSPVFITCCVLFLAHQLTQRILNIPVGFADNYLDNFLATPILLTLLLVERRTLFRHGHNYTLTMPEVLLATVFIAIVAEVLFPYLSDDFTSDWRDVPFYILGSGLFYATVNSTNRSGL